MAEKIEVYSSAENYQGIDYSNLLKYFLGRADTFQMVIRTDIDFKGDGTYGYHDSAYQFIQELKPFIFEEKRSIRWMASSTSGSPAIVYKGNFNEESLNIILKHTNQVNDWRGPDKPEDLSLMCGNSPRLSFIGHETISCYRFNPEELVLNETIEGFEEYWLLAKHQALKFLYSNHDELEWLENTDKFVSDCDYQGEEYAKILNFFIGKADTFEIVIKTGMNDINNEMYHYNDSTYELLQDLAHYLFEERRSKRGMNWSIYDASDLIYRGEFNKDSLNIILKHTNKIRTYFYSVFF